MKRNNPQAIERDLNGCIKLIALQDHEIDQLRKQLREACQLIFDHGDHPAVIWASRIEKRLNG